MSRTDIDLCWVNVHGGSFHALLHLARRLRAEGLSCRVLLSSSPPLGLQAGLDITAQDQAVLEGEGVRILPVEDMERAIRQDGARLCVFDAHEGEQVPALIAAARESGRLTAQLSTLLADFTYHGADYALVQHPISLWFVFDYSRERRAARLAQAKGVYFSGNVFYEPLTNTWTSAVRTREDLAARYGLDPARPILLWLPNREDGLEMAYGAVLDRAREAGMGVLVKLHPWEYKQLRHGFDPYGLGKTSAEHWGATAMDERDASWALAFCDAGIMRGSSLGLELPFWRKPGIYLPRPGVHARWHSLLLEMTKGASLHLPGVEALGPCLAAWPPHISDEGYAAAKRYTMPVGSGGPGQPDSLTLHARHLADILNGGRAAFSPEGDAGRLRALYEPEIPRNFYARLLPRQRALFALRRMAGLMPKQTD